MWGLIQHHYWVLPSFFFFCFLWFLSRKRDEVKGERNGGPGRPRRVPVVTELQKRRGRRRRWWWWWWRWRRIRSSGHQRWATDRSMMVRPSWFTFTWDHFNFYWNQVRLICMRYAWLSLQDGLGWILEKQINPFLPSYWFSEGKMTSYPTNELYTSHLLNTARCR